jgi:hypothetical protein
MLDADQAERRLLRVAEAVGVAVGIADERVHVLDHQWQLDCMSFGSYSVLTPFLRIRATHVPSYPRLPCEFIHSKELPQTFVIIPTVCFRCCACLNRGDQSHANWLPCERIRFIFE